MTARVAAAALYLSACQGCHSGSALDQPAEAGAGDAASAPPFVGVPSKGGPRPATTGWATLVPLSELGQAAEGGAADVASGRLRLALIEGTLVDDTWRLTVLFNPRSPRVTLEIRKEPYSLSDIRLVLQSEKFDGRAERDGGSVPSDAKLSYRLGFALDECEHEPPTPPGRWPGLCGYFEGGARPRRVVKYELLVDVKSSYTHAMDMHEIDAACVPSSGKGPSCQLRGTVVTRGELAEEDR